MGEIANTVTALNALYASSLPTASSVQSLFSSSTVYLNNGSHSPSADATLLSTAGAQFDDVIVNTGMSVSGGDQTNYVATPVPASAIAGTATVTALSTYLGTQPLTTKDTNGCVTSVWVNLKFNGWNSPTRFSRTIDATNYAATACNSAVVVKANSSGSWPSSNVTWTMDGNQRTIATRVTPAVRYTAATTNSYDRMFQLKIYGTGLGSATLLQPTGLNAAVSFSGTAGKPLPITSPGYASTSTGSSNNATNLLESCADTNVVLQNNTQMPCFDNAASNNLVTTGTWFAFQYTDPSTQKVMYQLENIGQVPTAVSSLSTTQFPTINSGGVSLSSLQTGFDTLAQGASTSVSASATLPSGYGMVQDFYLTGLTLSASSDSLSGSTEKLTSLLTRTSAAQTVSNTSLINLSIGGYSNGQIFFAHQRVQ